MLNTEDGRKLIARLCRSPRDPSALRSEVATMTLVRSRTSTPVPVVHFFEDSPSNEVGMQSQFLVMDYVEGVNLYRIWDDLTKDILTQIVGARSACKHGIQSYGFYHRGRLRWTAATPHDGERRRGRRNQRHVRRPFGSTSDYLYLFIDRFSSCSRIPEENRMRLHKVRDILANYFASHDNKPHIHPPFQLRHAHFDGQNLLQRWYFPSTPYRGHRLGPCTRCASLFPLRIPDLHTRCRQLETSTIRGKCYPSITLCSRHSETGFSRFSLLPRSLGLHTLSGAQ